MSSEWSYNRKIHFWMSLYDIFYGENNFFTIGSLISDIFEHFIFEFHVRFWSRLPLNATFQETVQNHFWCMDGPSCWLCSILKWITHPPMYRATYFVWHQMTLCGEGHPGDRNLLKILHVSELEGRNHWDCWVKWPVTIPKPSIEHLHIFLNRTKVRRWIISPQTEDIQRFYAHFGKVALSGSGIKREPPLQGSDSNLLVKSQRTLHLTPFFLVLL